MISVDNDAEKTMIYSWHPNIRKKSRVYIVAKYLRNIRMWRDYSGRHGAVAVVLAPVQSEEEKHENGVHSKYVRLAEKSSDLGTQSIARWPASSSTRNETLVTVSSAEHHTIPSAMGESIAQISALVSLHDLKGNLIRAGKVEALRNRVTCW